MVNAAKSSEIVASLFPGQVRDKVLGETKTGKKVSRDKQGREAAEHEVLAELYPRTTVRKFSPLPCLLTIQNAMHS